MLQFVDVGEGAAARRLATLVRDGRGPTVVWLGGFRSDMRATKAEALDAWATRSGRRFVRFDYSGHGESSGRFEECTISRWLEDALAVLRAHVPDRPILVGSSMGGWLALLLVRALRRREKAGGTAKALVKGLVLVAPAVDFTEELMWKRFPAAVKREIEEKGFWSQPSAYSDKPYPITRHLIVEGRDHLMFGDLIETGCPVRILQGVQDADVPWDHTVELVSHLARDDVVLTLVKDGDHRLSRPEDIERLLAAVAEF
jgi:pimeloyl-ACP methyl ester carboxylesterase